MHISARQDTAAILYYPQDIGHTCIRFVFGRTVLSTSIQLIMKLFGPITYLYFIIDGGV